MQADDGWEQVKRLIELAKRAPAPTLSPERMRRIRERLLQRLEDDRIDRLERDRRMAGALVPGRRATGRPARVLKLVSGGLLVSTR